MISEYSGSVNCILQSNNPRGLGGCCKAVKSHLIVVGRTPQGPGYPKVVPLAGLPYSLEPWNALPLTRDIEELRNRHS
jgi:hypothetical protein